LQAANSYKPNLIGGFMGQYWLCKNEKELDNFHAELKKTWDFSKPLKIEWKQYRGSRTLDQLALAHIWFKDIAKALSRVQFMGDDGELMSEVFDSEDDIKPMLKRSYGIIEKRLDPINKKMVPRLKSLGKYDKGELYQFLEQVQICAATKWGIILESKGEYKSLKDEEKA